MPWSSTNLRDGEARTTWFAGLSRLRPAGTQDEYKARAVVQKARELQGILVEAEARERAQAERRAQEATDRRKREKKALLRDQSALLLAQLEHAAMEGDPHQRGYLLEDLLNRTFVLHEITVHRSFRRNAGGEQIDAASRWTAGTISWNALGGQPGCDVCAHCTPERQLSAQQR